MDNESRALYVAKVKHIKSLIRYISKLPSIDDYFSDYSASEDGWIPNGVVVACDDQTFDRILSHSRRYYPDLTVSRMSYDTYVKHKRIML